MPIVMASKSLDFFYKNGLITPPDLTFVNYFS